MSESDRFDEVDSDPPAESDSTSTSAPEYDRLLTGDGRRSTTAASGLATMLGLWVLVSPILFEVSQTVIWNSLLVGVPMHLGAGYNYYRQYGAVPLSVGVSALVAVLGLWTIVAAFLFAASNGGMFLGLLVSGALITLAASYNVYAGREQRRVTADEVRTT